MNVNWLAVIVAAVVYMGIGATWYSPILFAKQWMAELGKKPEDMQAMRENAGPGYAVSGLAALVTAYVLAKFILYAGVATAGGGALVGLLAGLGFVATSFASAYVFAGNSNRLYAIDMGYRVVSLVVIGAILGLWH